MKHKQIVPLLTLALGLALGVAGALIFTSNEPAHPLAEPSGTSAVIAPTTPAETSSNTTSTQESESFRVTDSNRLLQTAFLTLTALNNKDYTTLSALVHKEKGLRLTPYSTVNLESDLVMTTQEIKDLAQDNSLYSWGVDLATGSPISLSPSDYFARYVTKLNYANAPNIATDVVILRGNALENLIESYPEARFVDFSFPVVDPEASGSDWSSLKLVFEAGEDAWYLVGIVHGEWTA